MSDMKQDESSAPGDTPGAQSQSSPEPASASADSQAKKEGGSGGNDAIFKRRSLWKACVESFQYVNSISHDEHVPVRDSDKATSLFLIIMSAITVVAMILEPLAGHRLQLLLVCDVLIGWVILYYLANRFGILVTFNPRQALLTWQLMMGALFFGVFLTINLAMVLATVVVGASGV